MPGNEKAQKMTADLWPEMFRVIQESKPTWVIGENVAGFVNMELNRTIVDLESEGYEVQPFIIPACAVNAPHRRDRVWIIAHANSIGERTGFREIQEKNEKIRQWDNDAKFGNPSKNTPNTTSAGLPISGQVGIGEFQKETEGGMDNRLKLNSSHAPDTGGQRLQGCKWSESLQNGEETTHGTITEYNRNTEWDQDWLEVATELCGVDDGLPAELDGFKLSKAGHRRERIKALGNAIVPQVVCEIMKAIKRA